MLKNCDNLLYYPVCNRDIAVRREVHDASYPAPSQISVTKETKAQLLSTQ
jgi:hypothetical protein